MSAVFQHAAVQRFGGACVIDRVVNAVVTPLHMDIFFVVHHVELFRVLLLRGLLRFQRNPALLANFLEMLIDTGDEFAGRFSDGIQTCPERFHVLILRPRCHIAEAVCACLNAEVGADGVSDALRFHFLRAGILRLAVWLPGVIVELRVRDLMDGGAHGLHLAHPFAQRNALLGGREKSVQIAAQRLDFNGNRRYQFQRVHERFVMLHVAGQLRNR